MAGIVDLISRPNINGTAHGSGVGDAWSTKADGKHGLTFAAAAPNSTLANQLTTRERPEIDMLDAARDKLRLRIGEKLGHKYAMFGLSRGQVRARGPLVN